ACGGRVSLCTAADAGGGHRHGSLGRDGSDLARRRRLDHVPPRHPAGDAARHRLGLDARLHSIIRRSDHDHLPGNARHRDAAGADV
ncbi:hypothetical protein EV34_14970, partial [Staphylococcus aureus]